MMMRLTTIKGLTGAILAIASTAVLHAQTIPVGLPVLEDYYRRQQLLGNVDSTISFSIRPLTAQALQQHEYLHYPDASRTDVVWQSGDGHGYLQLLPVVWQNQLNTAYPYGWNDGPMIPARGVQTYFSTGFFARYRWLSVQFRPELVSAQNRVYEGVGGEAGPDRTWYQYRGNRIDQPELFGHGSYTKAYLGQSSVRLTLDPVSLGFSTENLWWGPGLHNSILMSNTAPGFAHVTLNTSKPIKTYIGSFEFQVVGGHLEKSGYPSSLLGDTATHQQYAVAKPEGWRYFSGINLTYQPKWTPGLSLGFIRTYNTNQKDMGSGLSYYAPFLEAFSKTKIAVDSSSDDGIPRDQMLSFYFRYVVPKAKVEFYGEYAKNDHNWDARDAMTQLDHTRAYTFGLRKLVPLHNRWGGYLQLAGEVTQVAVTNTRGIRSAAPWYVHHQVRDGYANRGQLLGAGIGVGSNSQTVQASWVDGLKQLGVQVQRLVHDEDYAVTYIKDFRRNWVDASVAAYGSWDYKQFIFNAHLQYIHAYNYQWNFQAADDTSDYWGFDPQDKNNLHLKLGVMYRF
ncbi:capsule assembly Wzi family protein [Parapedobacter sp. 2B3]|uniref:capsule assembly Wzi family protein n=1 Tax=Parapedobacter sp. 2B3 TaxID=3342381 RepID=UPI0035B5DC58